MTPGYFATFGKGMNNTSPIQFFAQSDASPEVHPKGEASVYSGGGNLLDQWRQGVSSSLSPDDELRYARLQGLSDDYGASPPHNKLIQASA